MRPFSVFFLSDNGFWWDSQLKRGNFSVLNFKVIRTFPPRPCRLKSKTEKYSLEFP